MTMRILLLSQFYPPVVGGIEAHVRGLAHGMAERGHAVAVATQSVPGLPPFESVDGVEIHRLSGALQRIGPLFADERRHAAPVPDPEMSWRLRGLAASFRPDIVHAHNWLGRSFLPLKRRSGARYVVTLHDCSRLCAQGRLIYRGESLCTLAYPARCLSCCSRQYGPLKGALTLAGNAAMRGPEASAADLYIAVSKAVAEANGLEGAGVPYAIVPNFASGSSGEEQPPADAGELPREPFILQVGDVVHDKGVGVLLQAYAALTQPPPLVLVGRIGPAAPDPVPPGVSILGPRSPGFVREAWRRCLFGTIPSLCLDASPTVTLEAMSAGRAVVASERGGLIDQVGDGVTGILVPPGDAGRLAQAMAKLLADPVLRVKMGNAARARFEDRFASDVVLARIEALYLSLLSPGGLGDEAGLPSSATRAC